MGYNQNRAPCLSVQIQNKAEHIKGLVNRSKGLASVRNSDGHTALHLAAIIDRPDCARILAQFPVPVQATRDNNGKTAAILAAECDSLETFSTLMEETMTESMMNTLLWTVVKDSSTRCFQLLANVPNIFDTWRGTHNETLLHVAALFGCRMMVDKIISAGVDRSICDSHGNTALHYVSKSGNAMCLGKLIEHGINKDARNDSGETAIVVAVKENSHITRLFIDREVDLLIPDNEGNTPLSVAIGTNNLPVVQALVGTNKIDPESLRKGLNLAVGMGNLPTVEALVASKATDTSILSSGLLSAVKYCGRSDLTTGCFQNGIQIMKFLSASGGDINTRDPDGFTPIYLAASSAYTPTRSALVSAVLDLGGNPNQAAPTVASSPQNAETPFIAVMKHSDLVCSELILGKGAKLTKYEANYGLFSAIRYCTQTTSATTPELFEKWFQMMKTMVNCGADINSTDDKGCSPIALALCSSEPRIVSAVLDFGANPNLPSIPVSSFTSESPLIMAIKHKNSVFCNLLMDKGATLNSTEANSSVSGETMLLQAIRYLKNPRVVAELIRAQADPNTPGGLCNGLPLIEAVDNLESLRILLSCPSIDIEKTDSNGNTALFKALEMQQQDCVELLISKGGNKLTAAQQALRTRCAKAMALLLKNGFDPNFILPTGQSLLSTAISQYFPDEMVTVILSAGADPMLPSLDATLAALEHNSSSDISWLVLSRVDKDKALNFCVKTQQHNCITKLVSSKMFTYAELLLKALEKDDVNLLELFLKCPLSPDVHFPDGSTPLIYAINKQNENAVKLLLKHSASVSFSGRDGSDPHTRAEGGTNKSIARMIESSIFLEEIGPIIVADTGSWMTRSGWCGSGSPRTTFPTIVGRKKIDNFPLRFFVGEECGACTRPVSLRSVNNFDCMERVYGHIMDESGRHPIVLARGVSEGKPQLEKTTQIMFESLDVPALFMASQPTLALYSTGRLNGLVLDCGYQLSEAVPIFEGFPLRHNIQRLEFGGFDIDNLFLHYMPTPRYLTKATVIKERYGYIASNPATEHADAHNYELPDGSMVHIGQQSFEFPEALFSPILAGLGSPGIHEITHTSIQQCDADLRPELLSNIVLAGGTAKFRGLASRLQEEISALATTRRRVSVRMATTPDNDDCSLAAWVGGSIMGSLPSLPEMWMSKEDYDERGPALVHRIFLL
ncbi:actin 2 [Pelomyxa schiedti]|nr:actin 2 [Pelomyxa schiedti]